MNPAQVFKLLIICRLKADAYAVDATVMVHRKLVV